MMMLSQCVTFGSTSQAFFDHWTVKLPLQPADVGTFPATFSQCDWRETQDMLDFQTFVSSVKVKDGWPQVTATGVPLSVIIAAHHNLVTYGVPFLNLDGMWTNPGPGKTYYVPEEAITALAPILDHMSGDTTVTDWVRAQKENSPTKLDVANVPGMAKWVAWVKKEKLDTPLATEAKEQWLMFHGFTDDWTEKEWIQWERKKLLSGRLPTQAWTEEQVADYVKEAVAARFLKIAELQAKKEEDRS